jgi:hypothetical protein
MPRRNDISKILIICAATLATTQAQDFKHETGMLFDVDQGIAIPKSRLTLRFRETRSNSERPTSQFGERCKNMELVGNERTVNLVTDDRGEFVLDDVPAGYYLVRAEPENFPASEVCLEIGATGEKKACQEGTRNYYYLRFSRKLSFFHGDVLEYGHCRQWVPQPCADLNAQLLGTENTISGPRIKIVHLDETPASAISLSVYGPGLSKEINARQKNPRLSRKVADFKTDENGEVDLSRLRHVNFGGRVRLEVSKDGQRGGHVFNLSLAQQDQRQSVLLFQRGCNSKMYWDLKVLDNHATP